MAEYDNTIKVDFLIVLTLKVLYFKLIIVCFCEAFTSLVETKEARFKNSDARGKRQDSRIQTLDTRNKRQDSRIQTLDTRNKRQDSRIQIKDSRNMRQKLRLIA